MTHSAVEIIQAKRDGQRLNDDHIDWVIDAYTRGEVGDEQMAALAMAILLRGMDTGETARWTGAMVASGDTLDLSGLQRPTVDKHSTGGVGDKVTLVLTPLIAACGAAVPQLSGRGLGFTGGTLDKLEAIPGWRAQLGVDEMYRQLRTVGAVICAASARIAPADRALYALRDTTGTVESIPLIASSILSKKIAEGTGALVLDVKTGSGALMPTAQRARELAEALVRLAGEHGIRSSALLTDMSAPLGGAVGNALEVAEAVRVLRGDGPEDVREIVLALAREMLALVGLDTVDPERLLADGSAHETWCRLVRAQGGDPRAPLPQAQHCRVLTAPAAGRLDRLDARAVGVAAWRLGAGRARKQDQVRPGAGVRCLAKPGEFVERGQPLLELHTDDTDRLDEVDADLRSALAVNEKTRSEPTSLIAEVIRPQ